MPVDDPVTPGELSRRFDGLDRRLDQLSDLVSKLPSADLVATQMGRTADRVTQNERDIATLTGVIDRLSRALEVEREARHAELAQLEKTIMAATETRRGEIAAEREARRAEIATFQASQGTWVRWLLAGVVAALGSGVAQAFGWRG